jgi:hypothetical protein
MKIWLCVVILMTFETYLAALRKNPVEFQRNHRNPYADSLAQDLDTHLKAVRSWLAGSIHTAKMLEAMKFFNTVFPGHYEAKEGRKLYRGQNTKQFDGTPRSYSYDRWIADSFSCEPTAGPFVKLFSTHTDSFVIERKVCKSCADKGAFRYTLDLAKILSDYGTGQHKYSVESEVVILNTKPKGPTASVAEIECERT